MTNIVPGQFSDPLDPDVDFDGRLDSEEIDDDIFWFEAEDCIFNPVYDENSFIYDTPDCQIVENEYKSGNSRAIRRRAMPNTEIINSNMLYQYMVYDATYKIYFRAKTTNPDQGEYLQTRIGGQDDRGSSNRLSILLSVWRV